MFNSLTGIAHPLTGNQVELDVNGVGYLVNVSSTTKNAVANTKIRLLTIVTFREDDTSIYGFLDERERAFFKVLTSVQGVGAKIAMAMLAVPIGTIVRAIKTKNSKLLTEADGVGPKLATRLISELESKVKGYEEDAEGVVFVDDEKNATIVRALLNLGMNEKTIASHLKEMDLSAPIPDILRAILAKR